MMTSDAAPRGGRRNAVRDSRLPPKVLVAHASRAGSTAKAAGIVGQAFESGGAQVDVCGLDADPDPSGYDAVVLGTAIRYDRPLPELRLFVAENRSVLEGLPCALFFTCLALAKDPDPQHPKATSYAEKLSRLMSHVQGAEVGRFAGALRLEALPLFPRLALGLFARVAGIRQGEYLDEEALRLWARGVAAGWTQADLPSPSEPI